VKKTPIKALQKRKGLSSKKRAAIESIYRDVAGQLREADLQCYADFRARYAVVTQALVGAREIES